MTSSGESFLGQNTTCAVISIGCSFVFSQTAHRKCLISEDSKLHIDTRLHAFLPHGPCPLKTATNHFKHGMAPCVSVQWLPKYINHSKFLIAMEQEHPHITTLLLLSGSLLEQQQLKSAIELFLSFLNVVPYSRIFKRDFKKGKKGEKKRV